MNILKINVYSIILNIRKFDILIILIIMAFNIVSKFQDYNNNYFGLCFEIDSIKFKKTTRK